MSGCNECNVLGLVVKSGEKCTFIDASQWREKHRSEFLLLSKLWSNWMCLKRRWCPTCTLKSKSNAKANEVSSLGSVRITWPGSLVIRIPYWRFTFGRHLALKASKYLPSQGDFINLRKINKHQKFDEFKKGCGFEIKQIKCGKPQYFKNCNLRCWCRWCQGHLPLSEQDNAQMLDEGKIETPFHKLPVVSRKSNKPYSAWIKSRPWRKVWESHMRSTRFLIKLC